MKFNYTGEDLTKPSDFNLITAQTIFEELVTRVNEELSYLTNDVDFYDTVDECAEVEFEEDTTYPTEVIESLKELFMMVGWARVDYTFTPETDDDEATSNFKFYFKPSLSL